MSGTHDPLELQLLSLPVEERARLAELLLSTLDGPDEAQSSEELRAAWLDEAKRRRAEILSGAAEPIPGEEAIERLRRQFSS